MEPNEIRWNGFPWPATTPVYHATRALPAILRSGFQTRAKGKLTAAAGGRHQWSVSLTLLERRAAAIALGLETLARAARGEWTLAEFADKLAEECPKGAKHALDNLGSEVGYYDKNPPAIRKILDRLERGEVWYKRDWHSAEDVPDGTHVFDRFDAILTLYKGTLSAGSRSEEAFNPIFVGTDVRALLSIPLGHIGLISAHLSIERICTDAEGAVALGYLTPGEGRRFDALDCETDLEFAAGRGDESDAEWIRQDRAYREAQVPKRRQDKHLWRSTTGFGDWKENYLEGDRLPETTGVYSEGEQEIRVFAPSTIQVSGSKTVPELRAEFDVGDRLTFPWFDDDAEDVRLWPPKVRTETLTISRYSEEMRANRTKARRDPSRLQGRGAKAIYENVVRPARPVSQDRPGTPSAHPIRRRMEEIDESDRRDPDMADLRTALGNVLLGVSHNLRIIHQTRIIEVTPSKVGLTRLPVTGLAEIRVGRGWMTSVCRRGIASLHPPRSATGSLVVLGATAPDKDDAQKVWGITRDPDHRLDVDRYIFFSGKLTHVGPDYYLDSPQFPEVHDVHRNTVIPCAPRTATAPDWAASTLIVLDILAQNGMFTEPKLKADKALLQRFRDVLTVGPDVPGGLKEARRAFRAWKDTVKKPSAKMTNALAYLESALESGEIPASLLDLVPASSAPNSDVEDARFVISALVQELDLVPPRSSFEVEPATDKREPGVYRKGKGETTTFTFVFDPTWMETVYYLGFPGIQFQDLLVLAAEPIPENQRKNGGRREAAYRVVLVRKGKTTPTPKSAVGDLYVDYRFGQPDHWTENITISFFENGGPAGRKFTGASLGEPNRPPRDWAARVYNWGRTHPNEVLAGSDKTSAGLSYVRTVANSPHPHLGYFDIEHQQFVNRAALMAFEQPLADWLAHPERLPPVGTPTEERLPARRSPPADLRFRLAYQVGEHPVFYAMVGDETIGWLHLAHLDEDWQWREGPCGEDVLAVRRRLGRTGASAKIYAVRLANVEPEYQGVGIGTAMYEYALAWLSTDGPIILVGEHCADGETSPDARRVWAKLTEKYLTPRGGMGLVLASVPLPDPRRSEALKLPKRIKVPKGKKPPKCTPVDVSVTFGPNLSEEQLAHLHAAMNHLEKVGVTFDSGSLIREDGTYAMDWEWDWSLSGPISLCAYPKEA